MFQSLMINPVFRGNKQGADGNKMTKHMKKRAPETFNYLRKYNLHELSKKEKRVYAYESEGQYRNIRMAAKNASKDKMKFSTHVDRFDNQIIVTRVK